MIERRRTVAVATVALAGMLWSGTAMAEAPMQNFTCAGNGLDQFVANEPLQFLAQGDRRSYRAQVFVNRLRGIPVEAEMTCRLGISGDCILQVPGGREAPIGQRVGALDRANVCTLATAVAGMAHLRLR